MFGGRGPNDLRDLRQRVLSGHGSRCRRRWRFSMRAVPDSFLLKGHPCPPKRRAASLESWRKEPLPMRRSLHFGTRPSRRSCPTKTEGKPFALKIKSGESTEVPCKGVFIAIGPPQYDTFEGIIPLDEMVISFPSRVAWSGRRTRCLRCRRCARPCLSSAITAAGMGCQAAIEAEAGWRKANKGYGAGFL